MKPKPYPEIETKPDLARVMERILAWFAGQIVDRPPIRFSAHNAEYDLVRAQARRWTGLKDRWFDAEYQVESYLQSLKGRQFLAETIPVFWPNLGPEVYSAFHGSELVYQEVTSYSVPLVQEREDVQKIRFSRDNAYFRKIEEMTNLALAQCRGQCLVGYTDLHPGADCAAAWRDPQELCMDLMTEPELVTELITLANEHFQEIFDHFDARLKAAGQLSVTWMQIPSPGKMHIPSCDFSALISPAHFEKFLLPTIQREVRGMTHNVFHLDGKGVARNLDRLLEIPEIQAIQWVQGLGTDLPIMQWVPLIRKIRAAGKAVVVDLQPSELESFISAMPPEGIFLCIAAREEIQPAIIRRVEQW